MLFPVTFKKLSQELTPLLEQNKTEFTVNARCDHQGHLGFDISHNRFAEAILKDLDINEYEAKRGFEILLVSIAAQMSLDRRKIVSREEILASV